MALLCVSVALVLLISAWCSLSEAALYAVRMPYVRHLTETGHGSGKHLTRFKANMERPITAILIVNTISNTAGAAVAGAQAQTVFRDPVYVFLFSAFFTLAVLLFAEIMPKIIGVLYNRQIAKLVAIPWGFSIQLLAPLVWSIESISRWLKPSKKIFSAPEEEIEFMATIGAEEGSIYPFEARLVKNVLSLDDVRAADIMTPRPVVVKLSAAMTLKEVAEKVKDWTHSRIPLYDEEDPDRWVGIVLTRTILERLANDDFTTTLGNIAQPLFFLSEKTPGHVLLRTFLRRRSHIVGVVDEYGGITGVVTLEDVMESLIGEEIMDEVDEVEDLQEEARLKHRQQLSGLSPDDEPQTPPSE